MRNEFKAKQSNLGKCLYFRAYKEPCWAEIVFDEVANCQTFTEHDMQKQSPLWSLFFASDGCIIHTAPRKYWMAWKKPWVIGKKKHK